MGKAKITSGPDLAALAEMPGGGVNGAVAANRELVAKARDMGHTWTDIAAALSRTVGRPLQPASVKVAYLRQTGEKPQSRNRPAASRPAVMPKTRPAQSARTTPPPPAQPHSTNRASQIPGVIDLDSLPAERGSHLPFPVGTTSEPESGR